MMIYVKKKKKFEFCTNKKIKRKGKKGIEWNE